MNTPLPHDGSAEGQETIGILIDGLISAYKHRHEDLISGKEFKVLRDNTIEQLSNLNARNSAVIDAAVVSELNKLKASQYAIYQDIEYTDPKYDFRVVQLPVKVIDEAIAARTPRPGADSSKGHN